MCILLAIMPLLQYLLRISGIAIEHTALHKDKLYITIEQYFDRNDREVLVFYFTNYLVILLILNKFKSYYE